MGRTSALGAIRGAGQGKTLVDHGAGRLLLRAVKFAPGATLARHAHPYMRASLIVAAVIGLGIVLLLWTMLRSAMRAEREREALGAAEPSTATSP